MYRHDEFDARLVRERVRQFRGQVARRLSGELTEEQFRPLRLMNGLYLQLHAYMLRVAIPYGTLSSGQMRRLARIARVYDRGYGHFTTRQNIQYNWPRLVDVPDILDELADVGLHAIQTSGNCIRNVTSDHYAGATDEEVEDPRIIAEIIRQWSTLHPEFSFLPRKFKIAVTASARDRAALRLHDIGIEILRGPGGEIGCRVLAGGGQGRTPCLAETMREFLPKAELLTYLEAIMRVYNEAGRRDNIHKARIKILLNQMGADAFRGAVEAEYEKLRLESPVVLPSEEAARIAAYFAPPPFARFDDPDTECKRSGAADSAFAVWAGNNTARHKAHSYAIATISLKPVGGVPGDATAEQMDAVADLADAFSFGEIRVSHEQNLVLPHVPRKDLFPLWRALRQHGLATANHGLISDIVACPGLDYCNLANARSIPVAQAIGERFADMARQQDIGELKIRISGCINACGHHHVGHIGILGVDKKGTEYYQITLGGASDETAALGAIVGRAFGADEVPGAVETIVETYLGLRGEGERFLDTYRRVGLEPFRTALYPQADIDGKVFSPPEK